MSAIRPGSAAPAGFWHRYAAWSLDAALVMLLVLPFAWPGLQVAWRALGTATKDLVASVGTALADAMMGGVPLPGIFDELLHDPRLLQAATGVQAGLWQLAWPPLLGYALLAAPWHVLGEHSRWQGSIGKRALGLAVTDMADRPLSLARAALRHMAGLLSWLTLNLGHAMAAVPPRKRALHDLVAGTRVLRVRGDARMPGWARAWIVLQLLAMVGLWAWLMLRYIAALEAGIPGL